MIKGIFLASIISSILIYTNNDKSSYSQLKEWGIKGDVKTIKSYYTENVINESNDSLINPFSVCDRETVTYFNDKGMVDSIKSYNQIDLNPSIMLYQKRKDTVHTLKVINADTTLFAKTYWTTDLMYVVELFRKNKLVGKEYFSLDIFFKVKEIKSEYYSEKEKTEDYVSFEKIYFNKNSHFDSSRTITKEGLGELVYNKDLKFDRFNNPIKSIKYVDNKISKIIRRKFEYYQ